MQELEIVQIGGEAIIAISSAVVAFTQLVKWGGLPDKMGPLAVMLFSALGVALWVFDQGTFARSEAFEYFAAWITVATSAAGIFGFTRAAVNAVTDLKPPPSGGGAERTDKP